jgi:hypothetical protein
VSKKILRLALSLLKDKKKTRGKKYKLQKSKFLYPLNISEISNEAWKDR